MPNYSANSLPIWCQPQTTINAMVSSFQKGQLTFSAHKPTPKSYKRTIFLTTIATIPMNLEYNAWFAIIDPTQTSETKPISLHDHLLHKPWFLWIKLVAKNKCLLVTTQHNLPEAREWIDTNLQPLIQKSIPLGIDPPASLLLRQLDKPVYLQMCLTYANIF